MSRWVVVAFVLLGAIWFSGGRGDDLSASYIGCRLIASGHGNRLFSHDPVDFAVVRDAAWNRAAEAASFTGMLHPYVQTPLWALLLRPACMNMNFRHFCEGFLILSLLALSGMVFLTARHWATSLQGAGWIALLLAALSATQPFRYAMVLVQNQTLFLFGAVLALIWAGRGRPVAAGIVLALAAAVKITPGFLLIYWLIVGQSRLRLAAGAFLVAMAALAVLTLLAVGPTLTVDYVRELSRLSDVLLVAYNNQSLAAWWAGRHAALSATRAWRMQALPEALKIVSLSLIVAATIAGGLLDRRGSRREDDPPCGAVLAILAATSFTPIAWSHYYIVLILPVMLLLDGGRKRHIAWPFLLSAILFALNISPAAGGWEPGLLLRGQFFSGLIAMGGMVALALLPHRAVPVRVPASGAQPAPSALARQPDQFSRRGSAFPVRRR